MLLLKTHSKLSDGVLRKTSIGRTMLLETRYDGLIFAASLAAASRAIERLPIMQFDGIGSVTVEIGFMPWRAKRKFFTSLGIYGKIR